MEKILKNAKKNIDYFDISVTMTLYIFFVHILRAEHLREAPRTAGCIHSNLTGMKIYL